MREGKIEADLTELKGEVDESIIRQMSESMNYRLYSNEENLW
jgi:hypothetical protein